MQWYIRETNSTESDDLERLCKSAKEQIGLGFNATIGDLNLTAANLSEILKPNLDALIEILRSFRTPDAVEFVGGASKLSLLREAVASFLPEIPVLTSLNADEAATFGAIYHQSIQSKLFYAQKIQLNKTSFFGFTVSKGEKSREILSQNSSLALRTISFLEASDFSFSLLSDASAFLAVDIGLQKIISQNEGRLGDPRFFVNVSFDHIPQLETYGVVDARASNTIRGSTKFWNPEFASRLADASLSLPAGADAALRAAVAQARVQRGKVGIADQVAIVVSTSRDRLNYDACLRIVTSAEERASLFSFIGEVEANATGAGVRALKILLPKAERRLRRPLLRADELREREAALQTLQAAIGKAEAALPKATTDERAIERFREFFELTKLWRLAAAEVEPLGDPVILCRDILRKANTIAERVAELFAPKRRVTHFRTAPPAPEPEARKGGAGEGARDGETETTANQETEGGTGGDGGETNENQETEERAGGDGGEAETEKEKETNENQEL
jgi:hypothetical protein